VTGAVGGTGDRCIFCDAGPGSSRDDLVLVRTPLSYVVLNLYPYNNGHLMVVPNRHVATLASSTPEELTDLMRLTRHAEIVLAEAYTPQGINLGRPAGAGIVDHLHVHLVPRWTGDTSFISVVGNTRVLPEELPQTAARLRPIFERLSRTNI
jgi:ATP adenylyltransferase